jgi:hypothetical protein
VINITNIFRAAFLYNFLQTAFFYLHFRFVIFWPKKLPQKMLLKLTPVLFLNHKLESILYTPQAEHCFWMRFCRYVKARFVCLIRDDEGGRKSVISLKNLFIFEIDLWAKRALKFSRSLLTTVLIENAKKKNLMVTNLYVLKCTLIKLYWK